MAGNYDQLDIQFSWNGDILLEAGDIKTTQFDGLQSLEDQIRIVVSSALGDWEIYPGKGAGLDDYVGYPNTKSTGEAIHDRVRLAIVSAGLVYEEDLAVKVIPVHIHRVLIVVRVNALPSAVNRLNTGEVLQTAMIFDTSEREVFFLDKTPVMTQW